MIEGKWLKIEKEKKEKEIERYKDFKPTSDEERLETDAFGNTQADLVAKITTRTPSRAKNGR